MAVAGCRATLAPRDLHAALLRSQARDGEVWFDEVLASPDEKDKVLSRGSEMRGHRQGFDLFRLVSIDLRLRLSQEFRKCPR